MRVVGMKFCRGCDQWKPCLEGPDSAFHLNGTRRGHRRFRPLCKACRSSQRASRAHGRLVVVTGPQPRVPIEPFHDWLVAYRDVGKFPTYQALADALRIEVKRVSRTLRRRQAKVAERVVDQAVLNATLVVYVPSLGRWVVTLDDLYPLEEAA